MVECDMRSVFSLLCCGPDGSILRQLVTLNLVMRSGAFIALLIIGIIDNQSQRLNLKIITSLVFLASLGTLAFALITGVGHYVDPQYAPVAASIFCMVPIIRAWLLLKERLTVQQCL